MSSRASDVVREIGIFLSDSDRIRQERRHVCCAIGNSSDDIADKVFFLPSTYESMRVLGEKGEKLWQALQPHLDDEPMAFGGYVFDPVLIQSVLESIGDEQSLSLGA